VNSLESHVQEERCVWGFKVLVDALDGHIAVELGGVRVIGRFVRRDTITSRISNLKQRMSYKRRL
jgi:hypothetical protein